MFCISPDHSRGSFGQLLMLYLQHILVLSNNLLEEGLYIWYIKNLFYSYTRFVRIFDLTNFYISLPQCERAKNLLSYQKTFVKSIHTNLLVKTLISRNFCEKVTAVKLCNFHTVVGLQKQSMNLEPFSRCRKSVNLTFSQKCTLGRIFGK